MSLDNINYAVMRNDHPATYLKELLDALTEVAMTFDIQVKFVEV